MKGREADEHFMGEALAEARHGLGRTHPNPAVGAVIVKHSKVIARGFHAKAGTGHAEAVALAAAGAKAKGATIYSTLEPCNHFGRTPPCTQAIIDAGIVRVVYASTDPNPVVNGKGHRALVKAKLKVEAGVLREEANLLNRPYFKAVQTGLPWVSLKAAITLDGKIATSTGASKWISSEVSRLTVHRLRNVTDAIIVGAGTVAADDPRLTTRLPDSVGRDAARVIIDPQLRTKPSAKVYQPGVLRILVTLRPSAEAQAFADRGVLVWSTQGKRDRISIRSVLRELVKRGLHSVLVEGGAATYASFLEAGLVDEVALFIAPKLFGHGGLTWSGPLSVTSAAKAPQLELLQVEPSGTDLLVLARPSSTQVSKVPRRIRLATVK